MKKTKLDKLVLWLRQEGRAGRNVTLKRIQTRFRHDPSMVVYFNGLRRNGAISPTGRVFVSKLSRALELFRDRNAEVQKAHYERQGDSFGSPSPGYSGSYITTL